MRERIRKARVTIASSVHGSSRTGPGPASRGHISLDAPAYPVFIANIPKLTRSAVR
jgi:hypothetical protein